MAPGKKNSQNSVPRQRKKQVLELDIGGFSSSDEEKEENDVVLRQQQQQWRHQPALAAAAKKKIPAAVRARPRPLSATAAAAASQKSDDDDDDDSKKVAATKPKMMTKQRLSLQQTGAKTSATSESRKESTTAALGRGNVSAKSAASKQPPAAAEDESSDDCSSLFNKSPFDPPSKKPVAAATLKRTPAAASKSNKTTVKTARNNNSPLAMDADDDTPFHDTRSDPLSNAKGRAANTRSSDDEDEFFDSRQKASPEVNNNNNNNVGCNSSKPPEAKETTKPAATSKPRTAKQTTAPAVNSKQTAVTSTATTSFDKELEAEFERTLQQIGKNPVASPIASVVVGASATAATASTKVNTLEPRRRRHRRNTINEESKLDGRSKKRRTDDNGNGKPTRSLSLPPKPAAHVATRPLTSTNAAKIDAHPTKKKQPKSQQDASPSSVHTRTSTISSVSSQTGGASTATTRRSPHQTAAAVASSLPDTVKVANKRMKTSSHHHRNTATSKQTMGSPPPREPAFPRSSPRLKQTAAAVEDASGAAARAVQFSTTAAAAAIVPENDPSYNEDPTVAMLQKQCWCCAVPLQVGSNNSNSEEEQVVCWNVRHSHPSLQVPVCSVCAEDIAAETLQGNKKENNENGDFCAGCLASEEDVDVLLLCDSVSERGTTPCDRAFCFECVAKAQGRQAARRAIDDDASWHCPVCQPTNRILRLRQEEPATKRPVETVLAELETVESEKTRCEQELDRDPAEKAKEFRIDLLLDGVTGEELEEQVEGALQVWQEDWQRHHVRLSDRIARLLDELDVDHTLTAAECYNFIETGKFERERGANMADDDHSEDDDDDVVDDDAVEEPAWVRSANKVVGQRIRKREKNKSVWDPLSIEMYRQENYEDVEELDVSGLGKEDFENRSVRSGWEPRARPDEAMIQLAQECEARELKRRRVEIQFVVAETEDKEEEKKMVARKRDFQRSGGDNEKRSSQRVRTCSDRRAVERTDSERPSASGVKPYASPGGTASASTSASRASVGSPTKKPSPKKNLFPSPNGTTSRLINSSSSPNMSEALVLCRSSSKNKQGEKAIRTLDVSRKLSQQLKSHQAEGIKFMFENCFSDYAYVKDGDSDRIGGCILAHNMGLGKTFATIALLYTVMTHASMQSSTGDPLVKKVLLIVPVNTIANWENEFRKWLDGERRQIVVTNLNDVVSQSKDTLVQRWSELGGVLLISDRSFQRLKNNNSLLTDPDVVCLDEAHQILKNTSTLTYKKLMLVQTRRRIALTGSPFQNNLLEYFRLIQYVRPGVFGYDDEITFKMEYADPVTSGLHSDATDGEILYSLRKSKELTERLAPYVHRKDASELTKTLPPMTQVVLHVRPTKLQSRLYRRYERQKRLSDDNNRNNFFKQYKALGPVNNHPGSLLCPNKGGKADKDETEVDSTWWEKIREKEGEDEMKGVMNGYKMVLLLHILAYCQQVNDKVLIFAVDLSTHNYVEQVLALEDWTKHVPSLAEKFPDLQLGGWQKGEDFVRIDGSTSGAERGKIVDDFKRDSIKAFLISQAGGIGINLCEANRVVLVDNHFNPTVATQALFRAYRFGQTKPVFCYRLLTQGTVEEKVYKRCVTKTGVSLRIIDEESIKSNFSSRELQDLMQNHLWVQCNRCEKWRILIYESPDEDLPEKWFCEMNTTDICNNKCEHSEKTQAWYEKYIANGMQDVAPQALSPVKKARDAVRSAALPQQDHDDALLENLIHLSDLGSKKPLVSQYYFHDALLETVDNGKELERVEREISERAGDDAIGESSEAKVSAASVAIAVSAKASGAPARARKDGSPMLKKSLSPARKPALNFYSSQTSARPPKEPAVVDLGKVEDQRHFPDENKPQTSCKQTAAKPSSTHGTGKADDAIDLCFSDDE